MNSLQWLCTHARDLVHTPPSSGPAPGDDKFKRVSDLLSFEEIADRFEAQKKTLAELQAKLTTLTAELGKARRQLTHQHTLTTQANKTAEKHLAASRRHEADMVNMRNQRNQHKAEISRNKYLIGVQKERITTLEASQETVLERHERLQRKNELEVSLRYRLSEALFRIEGTEDPPDVNIGRAPGTVQRALSSLTADCRLVPRPFVMVLIDGDSYYWSPSLFQPYSEHHDPGSIAANEIYRLVSQQISDSNQEASTTPKISPHAAIQCKVLFNESGVQASANFRVNNKKRNHTSFRQSFTSAFPLFDYFDCGFGKERADSKIREAFELFVANPYCQHVYLAVGRDNGFARMLEPYRFRAAYQKITIIKCGALEKEIEALGFRMVDWPSVFLQREREKPLPHVLARKAGELQRVNAHNRRIGLKGVVDSRVAGLAMDMVLGSAGWWVQLLRLRDLKEKCGVGCPRSLLVEHLKQDAAVLTHELHEVEELD